MRVSGGVDEVGIGDDEVDPTLSRSAESAIWFCCEERVFIVSMRAIASKAKPTATKAPVATIAINPRIWVLMDFMLFPCAVVSIAATQGNLGF